MMKRVLMLLVALVLVVTSVTAFAEDGMTTIQGTLKNKIKLKSSYAENKVQDGIDPFTGLPASGDKITPIMVVLDNSPEAQPHWGVSDADIMFQVPNAGAGATKLLALFADKYPEQVGGIRSARATMVPMAAAFDAAFLFAGGPELGNKEDDPFYLMKKWNLKKRGLAYNMLGGTMRERVAFVGEPHNLSAHVNEIHEDLVSKKTKFTLRAFQFADEPRTDGESASYISMQHRGEKADTRVNGASTSYFQYDEELNAYIRSTNSGEYKDRFVEESIPFANVIVIRTGYNWPGNGYFYLSKHLTGSGVIEIFQNGQYVRGAWSRSKGTSRLVLVGPDGKELKLQRGKTFFIVTNDVTEVSYK